MPWRTIFRWVLAVFFIGAGVNHFRHPAFYQAMMPPWLPWPDALILISGVAEILGGLGVLVPRARRFAGWGLIALLVAVFCLTATSAQEPTAQEPTPMPTLSG